MRRTVGLVLGALLFTAKLAAVETVSIWPWPEGADEHGVRSWPAGERVALAERPLPAALGSRFAIQVWARLRPAEVDAEADAEPAAAQARYLDMWTALADGRSFFSRTLAEIGPMRALAADGRWRLVVLPADAGDGEPRQISLQAVLPGGGSLDLGPLHLLRLDVDEPQSGAFTPLAPQPLPLSERQ